MPKCSIIFILFALFFVQCYRADKNCLPPCEKLANNFYFHNYNKYVLKNRLFFEKKQQMMIISLTILILIKNQEIQILCF
jgi:hypothetical protein